MSDPASSARAGSDGIPDDLRGHYPPNSYPADQAGVHYELLRPEHAARANGLFNRVFGQRRGLEHYQWKFWRNPAGPPIGWVALEEGSGRLLAVNTGLRKRMWVRGQPATAVQLCESAVEPEARGGGTLFRAVTIAVAAEGTRQGVILAYGGRASDAALKLGQRLFNYKIFFSLRVYERRLSWRGALRRKLGATGAALVKVGELGLRVPIHPAERGYDCLAGGEFGAEFDDLWRRARDRHVLVFRRDAAALDWRYRQCPVGEHRSWLARRAGCLEGYLVWRKWARDGVVLGTVLDLFPGDDPDLAAALLSGACRDARRRGCDFLQCAARPGSVMAAALESLPGFRASRREGEDRIIGTPLAMPNAAAAVYDQQRAVLDATNWHYTQGDCDFLD